MQLINEKLQEEFHSCQNISVQFFRSILELLNCRNGFASCNPCTFQTSLQMDYQHLFNIWKGFCSLCYIIFSSHSCYFKVLVFSRVHCTQFGCRMKTNAVIVIANALMYI